jgi:hypothetical protein
MGLLISKKDAIFIDLSLNCSFDDLRNNESGGVIGQADAKDYAHFAKPRSRHSLAKPIHSGLVAREKVKFRYSHFN